MNLRYYSPVLCKFINADTPEMMLKYKDDTAGTNLFAYCNNDPVNNSDPTGYIAIVDDAMYVVVFAIIVSLGLFGVITNQISTNELHKIIASVLNDLGYRIRQSIAIATTILKVISTKIKRDIKSFINIINKSLTKASVLSNADTKIRNKINSNKSVKYWLVSIVSSNGCKYIVIQHKLSENEAKSAVRNGKSVFANSKSSAKTLAQKCSFKKIEAPKLHHKGEPAYYYHYHPNPRTGSHIFYL